MPLPTERRLLQATILLLCLSPLVVGLQGVLGGPAAFGRGSLVTTDLASHFRYLSGIFLGLAPMTASCVPRIEARTGRFGWVVALVVTGGLARLYGFHASGVPSLGHQIGLGLELIVTPLVGLWQRGLARRWRAAG